MFYATQDASGHEIADSAEIKAFETLEQAEAWLLSAYDPDDFDHAMAVIEQGEFSDCWLKLYRRPDEALLASVGAPFDSDGLSVQEPGSHPGGRDWWVTPFADVLVVASTQSIEKTTAA